MRAFVPLLIAGFSALAFSAARADVLIQVDKSAQIMTVTVDGMQRYAWPVSTGVSEYDTPDGEFQPFRMDREHYSREWDDAPMPYSIFFTQQGHAIHGTNHKSIGRPASHGCVRLSVAHAATLFALVKQEGVKNTKVVLTGEIPDSGAELVARHEPADEDTDALPPPPRTRVIRIYRDDGPRYFYDSGRDEPQRYYRGVFPFGW